MKLIKKIQERIDQLGGVKPNPLCPNEEVVEASISDTESTLGVSLPDLYKDFYRKYGTCSFVNQVEVKSIEAPPVISSNRLRADYFYSMALEGDCSILKLKKV